MTDNNILGRPITGDIENYSYRTPTPQKGPEEFLEALDGFFAKYPFVSFIRWAQGTPGFNDGEPCTFDLHEARFGLNDPDSEVDEDHEDFDGEYGDNTFTSSALYDLADWKNGDYTRVWKTSLLGHEIPSTFYEDFHTFASEWDAYSDIFQEKFGDPAETTATRDGFNVEYYEIGY